MDTVTQEAMDRSRTYFPPEEDNKQSTGGNGGRFDVDAYLRDYGIEYRLENKNGRAFYNLPNCLFSPDHKRAAISQDQTGTLGYNCFNNSCGGKTWKDARQSISGGDSLKKYSPFEQPKETVYSEIKGPQDILSHLETWDEIRELEIEVEWIVNKIIPKNAITLLYGRGGIGKTWLGMDFARSIGSGSQFLGFETQKSLVVYVDFENPVSVLNERTKKLGDAENVLFWRGNNDRLKPPKLDSKEWEIYKQLPAGAVIIFDTLRAAQNRDENSSQDMNIVFGRLKELRDFGFTVIILHHTPKNSDRVSKGSTAIVDLSDHIVGFHLVKRNDKGGPGSQDTFVEDDEEDALYRLGTGEKTRFEPFRIYLTLNPDHGFELAPDPQEETLKGLYQVLINFGRLNKTAFMEACRGMRISKAKIEKMFQAGDGRYWNITKEREKNNRQIFIPCHLSGFPDPYIAEKPEKSPGTYPEEQKMDEKNKQEPIDKTGLSSSPDSYWITGKEGQAQEVLRYPDIEPLDN
jgi:hypothetical protein